MGRKICIHNVLLLCTYFLQSHSFDLYFIEIIFVHSVNYFLVNFSEWPIVVDISKSYQLELWVTDCTHDFIFSTPPFITSLLLLISSFKRSCCVCQIYEGIISCSVNEEKYLFKFLEMQRDELVKLLSCVQIISS